MTKKSRVPDFTAVELREHLNYDPLTGIFTRKKGSRKTKVGDIAGFVHKHGYVVIGVFNAKWLAHQLAWYYQTGSWSEFTIDHRNNIRSDNRWLNLREATQQEQCFNRSPWKRKKSSQYVGVFKTGKKWKSFIRKDGVGFYLGTFLTEKAAADAYAEAKEKIHVFKTGTEG